jgi:hypothetical protein
MKYDVIERSVNRWEITVRDRWWVGGPRWAAVAVLLIVLAAPPIVKAMEPRGGDVPVGTIVDDDVLLVADNVTLDGTVLGDLVALGKHVTINGAVSGSVLAAGDTVTINGQVRGGVYALALDLKLGPRAVVGRNAHLVGVDVRTVPGAVVGRDVTIGAYRAVIGGQVERDLKTAVLLLDLQGQLRSRPPRSTPAPAAAFASARSPRQPDFRSFQNFGSLGFLSRTVDRLTPAAGADVWDSELGGATRSPLRNWPGDFIRNTVILLLVGVLLLWVSPRPLVDWTERVRTGPLPAMGYGVLVFVLFYAIAVAAAVLVVIIGIALVLTRLGGSVVPLYSFGFFGIGFALSAFTVFFSTISQVIAALLIGLLALQRVSPRRRQERALALVVGAVLVSSFVAIPFIGPTIDVLVGFVGLGAVWLALRDGRVERSEATVPVVSAVSASGE